ncbi:MAG: S8 family serine peptidase [Ignavibacteriae bacterium]|nr:S8 family serine peptidase [Ignavibacteriota bacterium]
MKKFTKFKVQNSIFILLTILFSFPFLSFRDSGEYKILNGKVIYRGQGKYYQVGVINIKFKNDIINATDNSFGIQALDNYLSDCAIKQIIQNHPLNKIVSKRKIGDEELAKIFSVRYDKTIDPFDFSALLKSNFNYLIEWVEPSFVYESDHIPNDPLVNAQWHISKINSYQAWDLNKGDTNIVIGIVDSGTDFDHPDLSANMRRNWNENPTNNTDDDNNGYIDDWRGWDFWGNDNDPSIMPSGNSHGSHVSGCASQVTNNAIHGAGIGYKVKLLLTKHTDDTNPESLLYNTDLGLTYCYQNGAK